MRLLGNKIEDLAEVYLVKNQQTIIDRNFYSRFGEIDLITQDKDTICFVEVRHRKTDKYGSAAESITLAKQKKIQKTALFFIQKNPKFQAFNYRFDVILSQGSSSNIQFEWIKSAF